VTATEIESVEPRKTSVEEYALAAILLLMALLPVEEIVARKIGSTGISGSGSIVQHCTLVLSMIGAAVAARRSKLLTIATGAYLPKRIQPAAAAIASIASACVSAVLCIASVRYVLTERESGAILAWGVPLWIVEAILPIGFAVIAIRLCLASSNRKTIIAVGLLIAIAVGAYAVLVAEPPRAAVIIGFAVVALMAASGAPIFAILGAVTIASYWSTGFALAAMAVNHYSLVTNPSLPAIPLFTLAGYILAEGGASRRLVRLFNALFGSIRGGPALATALACAFFTTFTGGSGVTILALGGLLIPILRDAQYSEKNALGFITSAGALGILFPPCLPLILYAIAANVDVNKLFLAGVLPGVLLLVLVAWVGRLMQPRAAVARSFDRKEALGAIGTAKWELLLPVIVCGVLFGGLATPVEASAITALYALLIEGVIHRDYRSLKHLLNVFTDSGLLVGGVLLILGVALALTGFLIDSEVPQHAVEWVTAHIHSKLVFLLLLNLFLIVVGAIMDIYSAIIVVVPLIVPLGVAFGIDPIHLGIIFLSNLELGYLVPPVGENLFIAAYRFDKPVGELAKAVLPFVGILLVGVALVTYWPAMSLWLPSFAK
jgi:tripartite ATP-independent transporter DctM subunit